MSESKPKRRGRPPIYEVDAVRDGGAPKLSIRFDPELYAYVRTRPEGARVFLERLVREALAAENVAE